MNPIVELCAKVCEERSHAVYESVNNTRAAKIRKQYFAKSNEAKDCAAAIRALPQSAIDGAAGEAVALDSIEQYRMQMAGISTAALGYWKEGDSIHPDYDTTALRDVAKLYAKYDALYKAAPAALPDAQQNAVDGNSFISISVEGSTHTRTANEWLELARADLRRKDEPGALPDGYVRVPREVVTRAALMLKVAAEVGIEAHYPNGSQTPNSKTCCETYFALEAAAQGERK